MGVVYKVPQLSLNRIVALKMLLPAHPDGNEMLARFRTEVEALAQASASPYHHHLRHRIRRRSAVFHDGIHRRPKLARLLDRRPQDPVDSARLIETLARTMQAVHQHGIIHRDLKPANVLLKKDEDARIDKDASAEVRVELVAFLPQSQNYRLRPGEGSDRLR